MATPRPLVCFVVLVAAGLAAASSVAADASADGWIGRIVPPYPDGVIQTSGTCIGDPQAHQGPLCEHAFAVLDDPQSKLRSILALEQAPHFGQQPLWRIVDALEPDEMDDRSVDVAAGTCQVQATDDSAVVALVLPTDTEWLAPVLRAWRFDTGAGKLVAIPVTGVRCRNEGFGYDG